MVRYLLDESAFARVKIPPVSERLAQLWVAGQVGRCSILDLQAGFSSRAREYAADLANRQSLPQVPVDQAVCDRAVDVQRLLAGRGQHRTAEPTDLIIAATAELAGLTVLHYDQDFDAIAAVTGQPTEWVVPRGSID